MSGVLAEGWSSAALGSLIDLRYGKGLPEKTRRSGRVPVFGSNGVVGSHDASLTTGPTIIVGRKGSVGEVHFSSEPCWAIDTTYFVDAFGPYEPKFLCHLLRWLDLAQHESSTAIPGLSRDDAYARQALVPPLLEQQRIVDKIEALFARVHAARDRLAKLPAILRRFRQSVLAAACSGRLTEEWRAKCGMVGSIEEHWATSAVDSICEAVVDCPHSTPKWTESGEVCLRTTNFTVRALDVSEVRYVSRQTYEHRIARLRPREGDVVYSREGGILGIACVIPKGLRACLGQRMMLMRANPAVVRAEFLCHVLNSPAILAVVRDLTGGTASPHLNVGDIKQFSVPLPSIAEQDEILRRVDALVALADAIERRVVAAAARADKLTRSILAKAFGGELVPTEAELARQEGREYEPASVLLERIKTERAASGDDGVPTRRARRKAQKAPQPKARRRASG
jgi:type I restriction enzyme S subunit